MKKTIPYPTAGNVVLIEDKIKKFGDYPTPNQLWKTVKNKIKYRQTFDAVIDYFIKENRILINKGQIVWIWNPKSVKKLLSRKGLIIL